MTELEYVAIDDPCEVQKVRNERFRTLKWSACERAFKERPGYVRHFFQGRQIPFKLLSEVKFKRSLFGMFLNRFNPRQHQDYFLNDNKLAMLNYDHQTFTADRLAHLEEDNNFALDLKDLLVKAVAEREVIDFDYLYGNILALKFVDIPLTFLDTELLKFRNLRILILCANWLTDVPGSVLPRGLQYIELHCNQMEYVVNFCKKPPKKLVHIGMGRNWLTNDSQLHLMGDVRKFAFLHSLDLSENDIYDLDRVLEPLAKLGRLCSLHLQGNPCSVLNIYKDRVLSYLPGLVRLDDTEILKQDRILNVNEDSDAFACIRFTCHRIIGLPKPPKIKGLLDKYYFSVSMPLLEDVVMLKEPENLEKVSSNIKNSEEPRKIKSQTTDEKSKNSEKKSEKNSPSLKQSKTSPKSKEANNNPYQNPNEYQTDLSNKVIDTSFKTERFGWNKVIQLPEDALLIESPEGNYTDIRDTFRSSVNVKLIYLQVEPVKTKVKSGGKKDNNKSSKNENNINNEFTTNEKPQMERIVKKITLANFYCDLHSINWSDKTIDFYWADHSDTKEKAIEVDGNLRALQYGTKNEKSGNDKNNLKSAKVPKIFTIQVGFGLVRCYPQDNDLPRSNHEEF